MSDDLDAYVAAFWFADANGLEIDFVRSMVGVGVVEFVQTLTGPRYVLVDGLTLAEALAAARVVSTLVQAVHEENANEF